MMAAQGRLELSGASGDSLHFNAGAPTRGGGTATAAGGAVGAGYASGATLDRVGSFQSGGEGSRGYGGGGMSGQSGWNGAYPEGELSALTKVLSLDELSTGEKRWTKQPELDSAIAFAGKGEWQSQTGRPLGVYVREEQKRMIAQLRICKEGARARANKLLDAMVKLDKYVESLNTKKRARPEGASAGDVSKDRPIGTMKGPDREKDRPSSSAPLAKGMSPSGGPHGSSSSGSAGDGNGANMRLKAGVPNKRVRTSIAEGRQGTQEGASRPSLPTHQKAWGPADRSSPRPLSSLPSPCAEAPPFRPASGPPGLAEVTDVKKMKGKRSRPKQEQSAGANGAVDGIGSEVAREHKWIHSAQRLSTEGRARPEAHGFRPGPVHGITSMHKAEAAGSGKLMGLGSIRSSPKREIDGAGGRDALGEKGGNADKDRPSPKDGPARPNRDGSPLLSPVTIVKGKATRGPRSSGAGPNSQASLGRAASFVAESRERPGGPKKSGGPHPTSSSEKKRKVSSRSPSPKPHWVGQRPQKMARVARSGPLAPSILAREEGEGGDTASMGAGGGVAGGREGASAERVRPNAALPGGSVPVGQRRNVPSSSASGLGRSKSMSERGGLHSSVGVSEGEESTGGDEGERENRGVEKLKDRNREKERERGGEREGYREKERDTEKEKVKKGGAEWEEKAVGPVGVKMGQIPSGKRSGTGERSVSAKDETGDGIRRQGRTGRGAAPVGPRSKLAVVLPVDKVESVVTSSAKQLRSARGGSEKGERSKTVSKTGERKQTVRPRRPSIGVTAGDGSGDSDDDQEELANAVQAAVHFSANACTSPFWKSVEPYFTLVAAGDVEFLHQQIKEVDEADPALKIPPCGEHYAKLWQTVDAIQDEADGPSSTFRRGGSRNTTDISQSSTPPPLGLVNGDALKPGSNGTIYPPGQGIGSTTDEGLDGQSLFKQGVDGAWTGAISMTQRLLAALIDEDEIDHNCHNGAHGLKELEPPTPLMDDVEPSLDGEPGGKDNCGVSRGRWSDHGVERDGDEDGELGGSWNEGRREPKDWGSSKGPRAKDGEGGRQRARADRGPGPLNGCTMRGVGSTGSGLGEDLGELDDVMADGFWIGADSSWGTGNGGKNGKDMIHAVESEEDGSGEWAREYRAMQLDDRILLELRSIGLMLEDGPNLEQREDDEICVKLRQYQRKLKLQIEDTKRRVTALESVISVQRAEEERQRERVALERLLEAAFDRRMGRASNGPGHFGSSAGGKGAASGKQARQLALAPAKRALKKMEEFEKGKSVLAPGLRDRLLGIGKEKQQAAGEGAGTDSAAAGGAAMPAEQSPARAVLRRSGSRDKVEGERERLGQSRSAMSARVKEERGGPERAKERTARLDEVGGGPRTGGDPLGVPTVGNIKRKRTERDLDGKMGGGSPANKRSDREKSDGKAGTVSERIGREDRRSKGRQRNRLQSSSAKQATGGAFADTLLEPESSPHRLGTGMLVEAEVETAFAKADAPQASILGGDDLMPVNPAAMDIGAAAAPQEGMDGDMNFGVDLGEGLGAQNDVFGWLDNFVGDDPAMGNADNLDLPEEGLAIPMDDISAFDVDMF